MNWKRGIAFLPALLCAWSLIGCADVSKEPSPYDWGLKLLATDVAATGLTLIFTHSGGAPTGELDIGSCYVIESRKDGQWVPLSYAELNESEVGWTAEAHILPLSASTEFKVNREWLYGELPADDYRIGKEAMDFRQIGDYRQDILYAEFTIN